MDIPILFEDAEALVIDKPAGLPLDRPRAGGPCLEDFQDSLKLGFQRPPMPVHRLDRDTSGCLLLARNPKALKRFSAAFEQRKPVKTYLGIVAGRPADDAGVIDLPLAKVSSASEGWRMVVASHGAKDGKAALTRWRIVAQHDGVTLIEFKPETGRTHQIRAHAAYGLGLPLLGDPIYSDAPGAAGRTMLHAVSLVLEREGKAPISASAPMPADFVDLGFGPVEG